MKTAALVGVLLGVLLVGVPAWAATVFWDPSANATSYELEQSADKGATWSALLTVQASTACTGSPVRCSAVITPGASSVTLVRFTAVNAQGKATRYDGGVWLCAACVPPPPPAMLGTP